MTLRKQFEEETGNQGIFNCANGEWIQPYVNWLVARDKEHLAKIDRMEAKRKQDLSYHCETLDVLGECQVELATLKQSIEDSTHSRFRIADWLDCDNPPDNWFKEKLYAIVDLKDELESWQETAEGNLNMLKDRDIELATLKQSIEEAETRVGYKMDDGSVKLISDLQKYPTKGMIHVALLELKDGE